MARLMTALLVCAVLALPASAGTILSDNFDGYADQAAFEAAWPKTTGNSSSDLATDRAFSAPHSVRSLTTGSGALIQSNYRDLGVEAAGSDAEPLVVKFQMYWAAGASRVFNAVRSYSGAGFGQGSLEQIYAVGAYNTVTAPGEVWNGAKYQARVAFGTSVGWFNLSDGPDRSEGWHEFTIEVRSNDVNFYVDGVLGRNFSRGAITTFDSFIIGSGLTSGAVAAWTDDVSVEVVPEPASLALLALAGLIVRRR